MSPKIIVLVLLIGALATCLVACSSTAGSQPYSTISNPRNRSDNTCCSSRGSSQPYSTVEPPAPPVARSFSNSPTVGQRNCPVTGEPLGSMGGAIPVAVRGETVYVCCQGCVAPVKKNPDKYLAIVRREISRRR